MNEFIKHNGVATAYQSFMIEGKCDICVFWPPDFSPQKKK